MVRATYLYKEEGLHLSNPEKETRFQKTLKAQELETAQKLNLA